MEPKKIRRILRDNINGISDNFIKTNFNKTINDRNKFSKELYEDIKNKLEYLIKNSIDKKDTTLLVKYINDNNLNNDKYFHREPSRRIIVEIAQDFYCYELKLSKEEIICFSIILYYLIENYVNKL